MYTKYYSLLEYGICVESELPINENTFVQGIKQFEVDSISSPDILISHRFKTDKVFDSSKPGTRKVETILPLDLYAQGENFFYTGKRPGCDKNSLIMKVSPNYSNTEIYHSCGDFFIQGELDSLTTTPYDHLLFAQVFPELGGIMFNGAGVSLRGRGGILLGLDGFAAKVAASMKERTPGLSILADESVVLRQTFNNVIFSGKWHPGNNPVVSVEVGELKGIFILKEGDKSKLVPIRFMEDKMNAIGRFLINPLTGHSWLEKVFNLIKAVFQTVPVYELHIDARGTIPRLVDFVLR